MHVAGTNGKGSVTAMVDAMLRAAGHRSARYTSPHLVDLRERFVVDWGVSETDARTLLEAPGLADYAEGAVAAGAAGKDVTNWVTGEVLGHLNETGLSPALTATAVTLPGIGERTWPSPLAPSAASALGGCRAKAKASHTSLGDNRRTRPGEHCRSVRNLRLEAALL